MVNFGENNKKDDMSMEDILASIRKYVVEDDNKQSNDDNYPLNEDYSSKKDSVVRLDESQIIEDETSHAKQDTPMFNNEDPKTYSEVGSLSIDTVSSRENTSQNGGNPFNKLTSALKTYGENTKNMKPETGNTMTIDKFLENLATPIIEKWVKNNISKIVEEIVNREIQKLKNG